MHAIKIFAFLATMAVAGAARSNETPDGQLARVTAYQPLQPFTYEVDDTRFLGYFLRSPDRCDVTVTQERADSDAPNTPPSRFKLLIAAGERAELPAGRDAALAIACAAHANAIKIAPQSRRDLAGAVTR